MPPSALTGAQKTRLRGLGQTLADGVWVGRDGASATVVAQLERELKSRELVKVRFTGGQDRHERAGLHDALAQATGSECIGAVGRTALFWRPAAEGSRILSADDAR
ncbi:MAG TPA: YhbY family RNA-binding protein [Lacunisphaera sp.]|jgi:RNA-binding protein|nr:YhbY family RNA-binding protein [Lacunisphaera sp.]